ncbi:MAG: mucoidy inhibitor MuiA family protein [Planctomycetota bacterium]|nr:mucoidy inhibitor MuiA family protein [Planctomycetota bacterium]
MSRLLPLVLVPALFTAVLYPGEAPEPDDKAATVASAITEVTVYADRARVTRTAAADLTGQAQRVAFRKLPGWVDDGSVRVAIMPADAGQVLDVEVKKTFLARPSDEDFRKAELAVRETTDKVAALDDESKVLDAQARQIDAIRAFSLDRLPKDAAVREVKTAEFGLVVDFVGEQLRKIAKARRDIENQKRDIQPELAARQRTLNDLHQKSQLEQRTVLVDLKGAAARNATLSLTYMVPGATWEPVHELRALPNAKTVTLASYAVVTQTTGEDWPGAMLALSTQQTSATMRLPELQALLVGSGRSVARVVTADDNNDSFERANKIYDGQMVLAPAGLLQVWYSPAQQQEYEGNAKRQQAVQRKVQQVFQALQQRGTTAHFAASAQNIRSDGRPVRVPIGAATLDAQNRIVAAPEVSLNAARTVDLVNTGSQPLLPGKVALFLEGAFLGATATEFVSPGESFSMFLGVADRVKLARSLDSKHSSFLSDGKRTRMQVAYLVTAENLADQPMSLQLADRVPVAETEEVRVRNVRVTPETRPDDKGLIKWELTLAPKQSREFRIEYTLEYPTDLPQRAAEQAEQSKVPQVDYGFSPNAPASALKEQIMHLEKQLKK